MLRKVLVYAYIVRCLHPIIPRFQLNFDTVDKLFRVLK